MAKFKREHTWNVIIDGVEHLIYCCFEGNRYVLYADDDHVANVYRKSVRAMWQGLEEPVTICGKPCLFIVWDEKPDIVVNGMLVGKGVDYHIALKKKNSGMRLGYRTVFWAGVALLVVRAVLLCVGMEKGMEDWIDAVISAVAGIWMVIWSYRSLRKLTLSQNRFIIGKENNKGANQQ